MKQSTFTISQNDCIAKDICRMTLLGDISEITSPGQFVNIQIDGLFLRRPISVCHVDKASNALTLIYKVVGKGTEAMKAMKPGEKLDILTGLGNGYDLSLAGDKPLLIGGGVGVPPLYLLAENLIALGKDVTVILGFNTHDDVFYEHEFEELGARVFVATANGSYGTKGFVTDVLSSENIDYTYFYTCGPEPMLRAVYKAADTSGQFSFEERMGCGFGACMGCSCKTVSGNKRICKDGPVLKKEDILWES